MDNFVSPHGLRVTFSPKTSGLRVTVFGSTGGLCVTFSCIGLPSRCGQAPKVVGDFEEARGLLEPAQSTSFKVIKKQRKRFCFLKEGRESVTKKASELADSTTDFEPTSAHAHEQTASRFSEPPFQTDPQIETAETDHPRPDRTSLAALR